MTKASPRPVSNCRRGDSVFLTFTMPVETDMLPPRASKRARKLTARAQQLAEDEAAEAAASALQRKQGAGGSHKRARAPDEENRGVPTTKDTSSKVPEFQIQTLASNRTSSRATNIIKLNANASDGIPRPKSPPAKVVAGYANPTPVHRAQLSSSSPPAQAQPVQPPRMAPPSPQPHVVRYNITELPVAQHVGELPRMSSSIHQFNPSGSGIQEHRDDPLFDDYDIHPRAHARRVAYHPTYDDEAHETDLHQHDEPLDPEAMAEIEDDPEAAEDDDTHTRSWNFDEGNDEGPDDVQAHLDLTPDVQHSRAASHASRSYSASDEERPAQRRRISSPSPSRSRSPEPEPMAGAQTAQRQPNAKSSGTRDYEPRAQAILNRAITLYKANLTIKNAYPDKLTEKTWAKKTWAQAAQDLRIDLAPDDRVIELILRYSWNLRSEYKTAARAFVQAAYGFRSAPDATSAEANFNIARADFLLKNRRFTYKVPCQAPLSASELTDVAFTIDE
ncbi:hypothetical protein C8Q76DRAFT_691457 [Earliella scabrosa]|nr:hypothetical protein C8Q76DRAFT_691457 [Earliella scabrosa]